MWFLFKFNLFSPIFFIFLLLFSLKIFLLFLTKMFDYLIYIKIISLSYKFNERIKVVLMSRLNCYFWKLKHALAKLQAFSFLIVYPTIYYLNKIY